MPLPIVLITSGDVSGIGPEVIMKSLRHPTLLKKCIPVIIGKKIIYDYYKKLLTIPFFYTVLNSLPSPDQLTRGNIYVFDDPAVVLTHITPGKASTQADTATIAFIQKATELLLNGWGASMVTAPITKKNLHKHGFAFPGHTEYLAHLTGTQEYTMAFVSPTLRIALVTIHEPIQCVPPLITTHTVLKTIEHAYTFLRTSGIHSPRIAVAGLNPHPGEFGTEEETYIIPAIKAARKKRIAVDGPFPADTLFRDWKKPAYDMYVCMYHDQGLIPLKTVAFDTAVNISLGLPFIRTSPDHGTAYAIAGKGIADQRSMTAAITIAAQCR